MSSLFKVVLHLRVNYCNDIPSKNTILVSKTPPTIQMTTQKKKKAGDTGRSFLANLSGKGSDLPSGHSEKVSQLINGCFEPSRPQGIMSGQSDKVYFEQHGQASKHTGIRWGKG